MDLQLIGWYASVIILGVSLSSLAFLAMVTGFVETGVRQWKAITVTITVLFMLIALTVFVTLFATCQTPDTVFARCR